MKHTCNTQQHNMRMLDKGVHTFEKPLSRLLLDGPAPPSLFCDGGGGSCWSPFRKTCTLLVKASISVSTAELQAGHREALMWSQSTKCKHTVLTKQEAQTGTCMRFP